MSNGEGVPLARLATLFVRHRRVIGLMWLVAVIGGIAIVLGRGRTYAAYSQFAPQSGSSNQARLAGLAAQLGVSVGLPSGADPIQFYAELLKSRELLEATLLTRYRLITGEGPPDTVSAMLLDMLRIAGRSNRDRLRRGVRKLGGKVAVGLEPRANLITLTVTLSSGELAEQVNRRMLELVNEFNLQRRQSEAGAERRFVEARVREAQEELRVAEDRYRRFLEANRVYQTSPQLVFEATRLQRKVDLLQTVYTTLAQAYEQARISEVRNTPVITVVDRPEGSARSQRGLLRVLMVASVVGLVLGMVLAFMVGNLARQRSEYPEAYEELRRELRLFAPRR